jgi:Ca2+-binding RTX toxin-like protein
VTDRRRATAPTAAVFALSLTALALLWAPVSGQAAVGDLTYLGCLTGETESGPPPDGSGACGALPGISTSGNDAVLNSPEGVAVSPDGKSVYASSTFADAILHFNRDTTTGAINFVGCITGRDNLPGDPCVEIPLPTVDGLESGLESPLSVVVSPEGTHVYMTSRNDAAISTFNRNTSTGALTYVGCLSGEDESTGCVPTTDSTSFGDGSGMDGLWGLAISGDGASLYATAVDDDAIVRFNRVPSSGAISFAFCFSGEDGTAPSGPCSELPTTTGATTNGEFSGLNKIRSVLVSPDGNSVYGGSPSDDTITMFSRNGPAGGNIDFIGCITANSNVGPLAPPPGNDNCPEIPTATATGSGGFGSGLDNMQRLAMSSDSRSLYLASANDHGIGQFGRDPATGLLNYVRCYTGNSDLAAVCALLPTATPFGSASGFSDTRSIAVSPDGSDLYAVAFDDAVTHLGRNTSNGDLTYRNCVSAATQMTDPGTCVATPVTRPFASDAGWDGLSALALSPDGKSLYSVAFADDAIQALAIERPPAEAGVTAAPKCKGKTATVFRANGRKLTGTNKRDVIVGTKKKDKINSRGGKDLVCSRGGNDRVNGGGGKDKLFGQGGKDKLKGASGNDKLVGGAKKDKLIGGAGADKLLGKGGNDTCVGGPGKDVEKSC